MKYELGNELTFIDEGTGKVYDLQVTSVVLDPATLKSTAIAEGGGIKVELKNDVFGEGLPKQKDSSRYAWTDKEVTL